jgi:alkylated DNA repair dioxygenase AlkB
MFWIGLNSECLIQSINRANSLGFSNVLLKDSVNEKDLGDFCILDIENFIEKISTYGSGSRIYYNIFGDYSRLLQDQTVEKINNNDYDSEINTCVGEIIWKKLYGEIKFSSMTSQGSPVPRLIAIQGDIIDGKYPLYRHPADFQPNLTNFSPLTKKIRDYLSELLGEKFNHVLIQLYRNGDDNIGEHSDKTLDIKKNSLIVNYSVGASRIFILKNKSNLVKQHVILPNDSLFVLNAQTNREWVHSIKQDLRPDNIKDPDELFCGGQRISFTFRTIETFIDSEGKITGQGEPKILGLDDKMDMLKAFSKENHLDNFDWDTWYGQGFNSLNFTFVNDK